MVYTPCIGATDVSAFFTFIQGATAFLISQILDLTLAVSHLSSPLRVKFQKSQSTLLTVALASYIEALDNTPASSAATVLCMIA
jgi:hypothetical protein